MDFQALIDRIVERVARVDGVSAIVLGGSRARGSHTPQSDIDLGIYYHPNQPLDLDALNQVAAEIDDRHRAELLTPIGGWGPWINGGGWLSVHGRPVDLLYRDLNQVAAVIDDCHRGHVDIVYQPGHPHGFVSAIYMAEIALCWPLWDPDGRIAALKQQTQPYPDALQLALIEKFAWESDFSLETAKKSIERADVIYAAGCCFRSAACMLQILFALNRQHWLNEKGALALADAFRLRPARLRLRMEGAFALLAADSSSIGAAISELEKVKVDVDELLAACQLT